MFLPPLPSLIAMYFQTQDKVQCSRTANAFENLFLFCPTINADVENDKMGSTWASSVYSPAVKQISEQFHVGTEVSLLGLSVLLCGFGLGPLLWAPLSEIFGRKPAVLIPYFLAAVFSFGTATAKDIQTIVITRFFAGLFGSAPVTNTGGTDARRASSLFVATQIVPRAYFDLRCIGRYLGPNAARNSHSRVCVCGCGRPSPRTYRWWRCCPD